MDNIILDIDDFAENPGNSKDCIDALVKQKQKYPGFKATLFGIPFYEGKDNSKFFHNIIAQYGSWIQIGIHGWCHNQNECLNWTVEEAIKKINDAYNMACFIPLFKSPYYQINQETYEALRRLNIAVADHQSLHNTPRPSRVKALDFEHPWLVHSHSWQAHNGILKVIEKKLWDENTKFHFISDIIWEDQCRK